jgi:hypothetical protein
MRCLFAVLVVASHCGSLLHRLVQRFLGGGFWRPDGRREVVLGYLQVVLAGHGF